MQISAFEEAQNVAAAARRQGYVDAAPAREYCIDGDVGPDKFWTRTVSVYMGDKREIPEKTSFFGRLKAALDLA